MALMHGWILAVVALGAIGVVILAIRRNNQNRSDAVKVGNAHFYTGLPGFRKAVKNYTFLVSLLGILILSLTISMAFLAARVISTTTTKPEQNNRDILLCLDVSGSMEPSNKEVLKTFAALAKKFDGERLGLVAFNSSAVTVFPLTNDYSFINNELSHLVNNMSEDMEIAFGTSVGGGGSLIGDGLFSCVQRFDNPDKKRSRSIIIATDNFAGETIVGVSEAAHIAKEKGIKIYNLDPTIEALQAEGRKEMESACSTTGGRIFTLDDPTAVPTIVDTISKQEKAALPSTARLVKNDVPIPALIVSIISLAGIILLAWRAER